MTLSRAEVGAESFPLAMSLGRPRIWPAQTFHDGIDYDAATGRVILKAPGAAPVISSLTSAFTFSGGAESWHRNGNGLLVQSAVNTPRIEYDANGACLGLLMELNKTNVALNSANLAAGSWTKSACSIGAVVPSVDGTNRSIRIVEDGTSAIHGVIAGMTITANTNYCLSAIVSPQGRQFAYMYGINTDQFGCIFDFVNLTTANIIAGTSTITQKGIIPWGGGRFLIWVSGVLNAASTTLNFVGGPATSLSAPGGYTYAGDGASGITMEYIQVEAGQFPTSRLLTVGSAVARTFDSCTRALGSEFSATAGTAVCEFTTSGGQDVSGQAAYAFDDGTSNESIRLIRPALSDILRLNHVDGAVAQATFDSAITNRTRYVSAYAWQANDFAHSVNGGAVVTDASGTIPTTPTLYLSGTAPLNGHIRRFRYWPTRLPNSVLQQLSAL